MELEEKSGTGGTGGAGDQSASGVQSGRGRRGLSRSTIVWIYYCLLSGVLLFIALVAIIIPIFLTVEAGIEVAVAVSLVEFVVIAVVFVILFYKADLISQCPSPESPEEDLNMEPV